MLNQFDLVYRFDSRVVEWESFVLILAVSIEISIMLILSIALLISFILSIALLISFTVDTEADLYIGDNARRILLFDPVLLLLVVLFGASSRSIFGSTFLFILLLFVSLKF